MNQQADLNEMTALTVAIDTLRSIEGMLEYFEITAERNKDEKLRECYRKAYKAVKDADEEVLRTQAYIGTRIIKHVAGGITDEEVQD